MDRIKFTAQLAIIAIIMAGLCSSAKAEANPVVLPLGQPEFEFL